MNNKRILALALSLLLTLTLALPCGIALAEAPGSLAQGPFIQAGGPLSVASKDAKKKKKKPAPAPGELTPVSGDLIPQPPAEPTPAPTHEPTPAPTEPSEATPAPSAEPTPQSAEPQVQAKAVTYFVEFYAKINGVETTFPAADTIEVKKGGKVSLSKVTPYNKVVNTTDNHTYYLNPNKWDPATSDNLDNIKKDRVVYVLYDSVVLANPSLSYTAKQGDKLTINIPIAYFKTGDTAANYISNKAMTGGQINEYVEGTLPSSFHQEFVTDTNITAMSAQIGSGSPFSNASVSTANGDRFATAIALPVEDVPEALRTDLPPSGSANKGLATFPVTVASGAKVATHDVPFKLSWTDGNGSHSTTLYVKVKVTKKASTSTGGGGGISSGTEKPTSEARIIITGVRTEPAMPKAGDPFTLFLKLTNYSKKQYVQNMALTYTATDDAVLPAGEKTNVEYVPKIPADSTVELPINLVAQKEIANRFVKMEVALEFEDQKVAAKSDSQTVVVQVLPVQKIKVEEPKLGSTTATVDESFDLSISIANTGKSPLYNVYAQVVSDNPALPAGPRVHGGQIDAAASKTLDLECTPSAMGSYEAFVEVTYEDENGKPVEPSLKMPFAFSASSLDDESFYNEGDDGAGDAPPPPPTVTPHDIMGQLPLWLYVALGTLVLLLIVSMTVSARKRRRRAMEDDEMD